MAGTAAKEDMEGILLLLFFIPLSVNIKKKKKNVKKVIDIALDFLFFIRYRSSVH